MKRHIDAMPMSADRLRVQRLTESEKEEIRQSGKDMPPQTQEECFALMQKVAGLISSGSSEFIGKEYSYLAIFCGLFGILIYCTVDLPHDKMPFSTVAFFVGALTSMLCGWIGMKIAVRANIKTAYACSNSIDMGFKVAFKGGQVLGFALVGLGLLILQILLQVYIAIQKKESYKS